MELTRRVRRGVKSFLRRHGYEVRKVRLVPPPIDVAAALTVKDSESYSVYSSQVPVWTPWLGHPEFRALYEDVKAYTIVSPDRCHMLVSLAHYATHLERGDFAECGVYKGGTALLLARVLRHERKTLYLFDSFNGLPKPDDDRDKWFHQGEFAESVESVKQLFQGIRERVDIRQGWIPDSFAGLENNHYAFVHIDVDLYRSALDCCEYFYPRMVAGGLLLFDEYGFPAARGERDAVDEFFADKPESPISLPTGQAIVIKLPA